MRDYTQKDVYIGIDVHKKTYSVAVICEGAIAKRDTLPAYPQQLLRYIKKYFAGAKVHTVYEAGFSGFHLHRILQAEEIDSMVVHPGSIEVSSRNRVKTDKRDALKLAKQLSDKDLKGVQVPSEKRELFRTLTRTRDQVLGDRKRAGNQLKGLLFLHGLIAPDDDTKVCKTWMEKVRKLDVPEELRYSIELHIRRWVEADDMLKEILKRLKEQAENDKSIDSIYRSVPGIGALSARILSNELGDMSTFKGEKKLFSYTGLTPSEYSSGEHRRQGSISRQGKSILRKILVQSAWRAIKMDPKLGAIFDKTSKRVGKKRAIVGIARRMIGYIRACFVNGELWCTNAPEPKESLAIKAEAC